MIILSLTNLRLIFTFAILTILTLSCSTTTSISTDNWLDHFEPGHTKDEIMRDFDMHKERWWNYYARGCWFAEGKYWDAAILDFKRAMKVRPDDQRFARSYGMHFWDYFVHREIGVCFYYKGMYEEATKELETSLKTIDNAKTKYYLNKARTMLLSQKDIDKKPPVIQVSSIKDGGFVNSMDIVVKGMVKDDYFSNTIWVNDNKLFIELAAKELSFDRKIKLQPGVNKVSVKASDLIGNVSQKTLNLTLDMQPPLILLSELPARIAARQNALMLKGTLVDNFGIEQFWINNKKIKIKRGKEVLFNEQINMTNIDTVAIKVMDVAGNVVQAKLTLDQEVASLQSPLKNLLCDKTIEYPSYTFFDMATLENVTQLASNDNNYAKTILASVNNVDKNITTSAITKNIDNEPPKIITNLKQRTIYEKRYVISGEVHDDHGIAKLFVNGKLIPCKAGKVLFFNHILTLKEGENHITISVEDFSGNKAAIPPVIIRKETYDFLETDARYTVAMMPLKRSGSTGTSPDLVYSLLMDYFDEEPKRFNFVERDKASLLQILNEHKISNLDYTSTDSVIKIGKIKTAEGMLFGTVIEDDKSLSISLNLVDTETTKVISRADVYGEDKSVPNLRWLMRGLAMKIKQTFPMLQGSIVHVSKKGFFVDLGSNVGAVQGMKFLLYREVDLGASTIKEPLDVEARVVQVDKDSCMAKILRNDTNARIEQDDLVITK